MMKMIYYKIFFIIYTVHIIYALPLSEFFPYGPTANDKLFPVNDDSSTNALHLSKNFPYFNNNHRQIYLSNNGLFSFLGPIGTFVPDPFPLDDSRRLIAGFWSDIDTRGFIPDGNKVYYHIYDNQNGTTVFEKTKSYIQQYFPGESSFYPSLVITGTWYRVGAYSQQTNLKNTFQIVLATDEMRSFAFLLYHDLQWASPSSVFNTTTINELGGQAGFNGGDGIVFEMLPYSRTSNVRQLVNISNVNVPGLFVFRIDTDTISVGGCSNDSSLLIRPRRGSQLGFTPITVQGLCFRNVSENNVKCRFGDSIIVDAIVINEFKAICLSPMVSLPSFVQVSVSIDGGMTYQYSSNIFTYTPAEYGFSLMSNTEVILNNHTDMIIKVGEQITLTWFLSETTMNNWLNDTIKLEVQLVNVALNNSNNGIMENSRTVLQSNIEPILGNQAITITIPMINTNALSTVFFRIIARDLVKNRIYMGLNSAIFILHNNAITTTGYCNSWASEEPSPLTWNEDLLPCPLTLAQARVARCCYEQDLTCMENSLNPLVNCQFRRGRSNFQEASAIACYQSLSTNQWNAGAECCYDIEGQLITRGTGGGTDDRYRPVSSPVLHFFSDILPFYACCLLTTNTETCARYFVLRPHRRGSNTQNAWGSSWGDPHYLTLDGTPYTFNGYGEYTYLAISNTSTPINADFNQYESSLIFNAQVRTTPLTLSNGAAINSATVIRGLAAKSNHPLAETMSITVSRRELLIVRRGNETLDLTTINDDTLISNNSLLLFYPEMTLEQNRSSGILTLSWFTGVSIQITPILVHSSSSQSSSSLVLNIGISVAGTHKNRTFGLLGLYDSNPANDLRARNGSIIVSSDTLALEEIHHKFGETWLINPNCSLFYYEIGQSAIFYNIENHNYIPSFLTVNPPADQINKTYATCNIDLSSTNQSTWTVSQRTCYYDIAVTNDYSLGQASRTAADTAVQIAADQRNPPEFNSKLPLSLTVNGSTSVTIDFTAVSSYNAAILYTLLQGPLGATFNDQTALFHWQTPSSKENDTIIRVRAQDTQNQLLSIHELVIRITRTTSAPGATTSIYPHNYSIYISSMIIFLTYYFI